MEAATPVASVVRVGLAGMKGTRHLARDQVSVDAFGPVGDRDWCLVDTERSQVLRTVAHPLMQVGVETSGDELTVILPDGRTATGTVRPVAEPVEVDYWERTITVTPYDGGVARLLTGRVDRPTSLARVGRGDVVFGAPVSLVGTASLRGLAQRMGRDEPVLQPERFRSTVVVETEQPWIEDEWLGRELCIGQAVVRVHERIGRCGVPNLHPETGIADTPILKALSEFRPTNDRGEPFLAVDAFVVSPALIRTGDRVLLR